MQAKYNKIFNDLKDDSHEGNGDVDGKCANEIEDNGDFNDEIIEMMILMGKIWMFMGKICKMVIVLMETMTLMLMISDDFNGQNSDSTGETDHF